MFRTLDSCRGVHAPFSAAGRIGPAFTPGNRSERNASVESSTHPHTGTLSRPKRAEHRLGGAMRRSPGLTPGYGRSPAPRTRIGLAPKSLDTCVVQRAGSAGQCMRTRPARRFNCTLAKLARPGRAGHTVGPLGLTRGTHIKDISGSRAEQVAHDSAPSQQYVQSFSLGNPMASIRSGSR